MKHIFFTLLIGFFLFSCSKPEPVLTKYFPLFGPPETLITVTGENFNNITKIDFDDDVPADFNPSYGASFAILFRVPEDAPLGDNTIEIVTEGGVIELPFRVTLEAPELLSFFPFAAPVGGEVTFVGENFFEPLEILFFDSIPAVIKYWSPDSVIAIVPENSQKGFIKIKANGGTAITNKKFFTTKDHLISDFDGNGIHEDIKKWLFYGTINENAFSAVQNTNPEPLKDNFLKLSGKDAESIWFGGTEHASFDATVFNKYDITSDINNTFIEFDINNNGRTKSQLTIIMKQRDGSFNDFSETLKIDGLGWNHISLPLNRFVDVTGKTIDPSNIKVVKLHLVNPNKVSDNLEVNIDNLKFVEVL